MAKEAAIEKITEQDLLALAARALGSFGVKPDDANAASRILVMADMFGIHTHGVSRVASYGERLRIGGINATPRMYTEQLAPALAKVDGDNGLGPVVGMRALDAALASARACGVGVAFARASNHFGPISPYSYLAAQEGFASIIVSNATTTIAPWGGSDARLGNNPMGFGIPHPGQDPILLDMAMSVVARAKIRRALELGQAIPDTWATDRAGRPTADPRAALDGFLLAIGGHKGYGLALMVDLFAGLLSGAAYLTHVKSWVDNPEAPQNLGHFFLLIDAKLLGSPTWLAQRIADFGAILHASPATDPAHPVIVPGEIEMRKFHQAEREGVPVEAKVMAELRALAG